MPNKFQAFPPPFPFAGNIPRYERHKTWPVWGRQFLLDLWVAKTIYIIYIYIYNTHFAHENGRLLGGGTIYIYIYIYVYIPRVQPPHLIYFRKILWLCSFVWDTSNGQKTTLRYYSFLRCGHPKHPKTNKKNPSMWSSNDHQMSSIPSVFPPSTMSSQPWRLPCACAQPPNPASHLVAVSMCQVAGSADVSKKTPDIWYVHMFKGWKFLLRGVFWWYISWTKKTSQHFGKCLCDKKNKQYLHLQHQLHVETFLMKSASDLPRDFCVEKFVENPTGRQLLQTPQSSLFLFPRQHSEFNQSSK